MILMVCLCSVSESCDEIGEVRLRGGAIPSEGRVELCLNNTWGSICTNSWDGNNAAVVCNQLGFAREGKKMSNQSAH